MAIDGDTIVVGAYPESSSASGGESDNSATSAGAAYVFSSATPTACSLGYYSATGNEPCLPADAGHYVDTTGATDQTECAAGTYQPDSAQTSCLDADAGHYVPGSGATSETACLPGYYQPNSAQISCLPADPGHYVDTAGATGQGTCDPGYYQPASAQTSCLTADPGHYVDTAGADHQTACDPGYYQPNSAQTSCLTADPGHYVDSSAATGQAACDPGYYQPNSAQISRLGGRHRLLRRPLGRDRSDDLPSRPDDSRHSLRFDQRLLHAVCQPICPQAGGPGRAAGTPAERQPRCRQAAARTDIKNITRSLATWRWAGEDALSPRFGWKVFNYEKRALTWLWTGPIRGNPALSVVANDAINELIAADRELVVNAIAASSDSAAIARANKAR